VIYLENNSIVSIEEKIFRQLENLETVTFNDNLLTEFPEEIFHKNSDLRVINLKNSLQSYPPSMFKNLTQLRDLYLSNNPVNMPHNLSSKFNKLEKLLTLWLSLTNIAVIEVDAFKCFLFND